MYNGIEINEGILLANNIIFTLILLFLVVVGVFAFVVFRNSKNSKTEDRIKHLKLKADTDPEAKKQLEKLQRKFRKKNAHNTLDKVLVFSLLVILIFINLFVAVIPGWVDYIKKDYVVIGGDLAREYDVHRTIRYSTITLEDGTVLTGSLGLSEGKHSYAIVYSRRTKYLLGVGK